MTPWGVGEAFEPVRPRQPAPPPPPPPIVMPAPIVDRSPARLYSTLTIKSVDTEQRIIEGTATTPASDRVQDRVDPLGVKIARLPLPLLWQHDTESPVGSIFDARATADGIEIKAKIPRIDDTSSEWFQKTERAWIAAKSGLVRGLSIGFLPGKTAPIPGGGTHFLTSELTEVSLVTIPANIAAGVHTIRALDTESPQAAADAVPRTPNEPLIKSIMQGIGPVIKEYVAKEIAKAVNSLQTQNAELHGKLASMQSSIDGLRQGLVFNSIEPVREQILDELRKDVPTWRGVWAAGAFTKNSMVTLDGALWIALRDTGQRPGAGEDTGWQLCAKSPKNGRSAYELARSHGLPHTSTEREWLESLCVRSGAATPR